MSSRAILLMCVIAPVLSGCAAGRTPVPALESAEVGPAESREVFTSNDPQEMPSETVEASEAIDFQAQVIPMLEAHCRPCHFEGGKMYDRMPFDQAETIRDNAEGILGRIKDEPEQGILRDFLAQSSADHSPSAP